MARDDIQHGIDNDPNNDAEKGATLGGVGGAVVGAAAGSLVGPAGTAIGAVVGGLVGAAASGAAVSEVDKHDDDNTVSGLSDGAGATTYSASDNSWDSIKDRYRALWLEQSTTADQNWDDIEYEHRYVWERANHPTYSGRAWEEIEANLRSDWQVAYPDRPWDESASRLSDAWTQAGNFLGNKGAVNDMGDSYKDTKYEDGIKHGIDDDPHNDDKKGAALGGGGGAVAGAAAGSLTGPAGAAIGAVVGGLAGAAASGAAVHEVDKHDNDNNVTGLGDKVDFEDEDEDDLVSESDLSPVDDTSRRTEY